MCKEVMNVKPVEVKQEDLEKLMVELPP